MDLSTNAAYNNLQTGVILNLSAGQFATENLDLRLRLVETSAWMTALCVGGSTCFLPSSAEGTLNEVWQSTHGRPVDLEEPS